MSQVTGFWLTIPEVNAKDPDRLVKEIIGNLRPPACDVTRTKPDGANTLFLRVALQYEWTEKPMSDLSFDSIHEVLGKSI